ncbi:tyrosine-protein phosphatase YwqE [Clostridium puniceum]|uniref:protein-tyrosine-phosphatase n=1 Tax=Clostridium puniceum TaxID=29367 RepID=A0A1S8TDW5_9CLOT|nr:CpsB/CapC family capsule biosynthesis tyrosine phosphatase [Clostridium puniceum]OOM75809.1 tyrosine-protein phosphatase YwqE [Clostridium puniceum]
MIDIHSHILPQIDDGAENTDMTLEMLRNAVKNGTEKIVATPHYSFRYGSTPIIEVKDYVNKLNCLMKEKNIRIEIYSGQEVYLSESTLEYYLEGNIGTINDSKYMLTECSINKFNEHIFDVIYELKIRGVIPIIAHPERYNPVIENILYINKFIENGCLFQMNSGSVLGLFGQRVKLVAEIFLKNGIYNFIGSDAHNNINRTTGLAKAINLSNNINAESEKNFMNNASKLIENKDIKFSGQKIKEKKSIFHFLNKTKKKAYYN